MKKAPSSRLRVELLEDRCNPAGIVTSAFSGGTWTLTGDGSDNDITINPTAVPGQFVVIGNVGTAVNGTNPSGVNNIVVKMLGGADSVTLNNTGTPATLAGNLTVDGGSEANSLFVSDMTVGKNLTITNGTNKIDNTDRDFTAIINSTVLGKVAVNNGDGDTATYFYRLSAGLSFIGKGFTITNGKGSDLTIVQDTNLGGSFTVKNGLPNQYNVAGFVQLLNAFNTSARSVINGNVSVNFISGNTSNSNTVFDAEVMGNVIFNNGTGTARTIVDGYKVALPVVIRGNLSIAGTGAATIELGTSSSTTGLGLIVGKKLKIAVGDNGSTLNVFRATIGGATKIQTGAGADNVTIDDSVFHGFRLATGLGIDTVNLETQTGTANVTQFLGKTKMDLGGGTDTLTLGVAGQATQQVQVFGRTSLSGGTDADTDTLNDNNLLAIFFTPTLNFEA